MSTHVCKLICDDGEFFLAFNTTVDVFVSPTFRSVRKFARYVVKNLSVAGSKKAKKSEWRSAAKKTKNIYRATRDVIHNFAVYLGKLKRGKSLSDDEACELYEFYRFLKATVADHQHDYPETNEATFNRLIDELGVRQQFPKHYDWNDILDASESKVFFDAWANRKYDYHNEPTGQATPEQNKFVGRYLSALAIIARIAGPDKRSPIEIVKFFLD